MVIFGDYDVDGVTSTALLLEVLRRLSWTVDYYLPHRMDEGYGLSQEAVENCLAKRPATLLLAVDCGSNAADCIAYLRQRSVDVIVLDHHQVSSPLPAAIALVNPQLASFELLSSGSCSTNQQAYPGNGNSSRDLCSVGLAFKLAHALIKRGRLTGLGDCWRTGNFDRPKNVEEAPRWLETSRLGEI